MAPFGKVYTYPNNFRIQRVQAIAALNGLTIEVPDFQMGVSNRTPEFLAKFPLGKVPAFESGDGTFYLTEGQAIARYVAQSGPKADQLLGAAGDAKTSALIEQWSCFAEQELAGNLIPPLLMCLLKAIPYDEARFTQHVAAVEKAAQRVETELKGGKKFLVGDQLTLADIMVFSALHLAGKYVLDKEMRKELPNVEAYLQRVLEVPEMKEAFGSLELCEKRLTGQ